MVTNIHQIAKNYEFESFSLLWISFFPKHTLWLLPFLVYNIKYLALGEAVSLFSHSEKSCYYQPVHQ